MRQFQAPHLRTTGANPQQHDTLKLQPSFPTTPKALLERSQLLRILQIGKILLSWVSFSMSLRPELINNFYVSTGMAVKQRLRTLQGQQRKYTQVSYWSSIPHKTDKKERKPRTQGGAKVELQFFINSKFCVSRNISSSNIFHNQMEFWLIFTIVVIKPTHSKMSLGFLILETARNAIWINSYLGVG